MCTLELNDPRLVPGVDHGAELTWLITDLGLNVADVAGVVGKPMRTITEAMRTGCGAAALADDLLGRFASRDPRSLYVFRDRRGVGAPPNIDVYKLAVSILTREHPSPRSATGNFKRCALRQLRLVVADGRAVSVDEFDLIANVLRDRRPLSIFTQVEVAARLLAITNELSSTNVKLFVASLRANTVDAGQDLPSVDEARRQLVANAERVAAHEAAVDAIVKVMSTTGLELTANEWWCAVNAALERSACRQTAARQPATRTIGELILENGGVHVDRPEQRRR